MATNSAMPTNFRNSLPASDWRRFALGLLLAAGCSSRNALNLHGTDSSVDVGGGPSRGGASGQTEDGSATDGRGDGGSTGVTGSGGLTGSGGNAGNGGLAGSGGVTQTGGVAGSAGFDGTGGVVGSGGNTGSGGRTGSGGLVGSGGATHTGGVAGSGGVDKTGGAGGKGGTPGAGGVAGTSGGGGKDGAAGSSGTGGLAGTGGGGVFGLPCTTNQDCPSDAICCDGSDPSCDNTRLPSGDSRNPGEFVVSADSLSVTDAITGLVWQRDSLGARAGCSNDLNCSGTEAQAYCASLVLGGISGWHSPRWMELLTLLNITPEMLSIDQQAFPNGSQILWTSSVFAGGPGIDLYIDFSEATTSYCSNDSPSSVRCVRGARCYPTVRFAVLDGGLVRDTLTELVWQQQGSSTMMTWADAQSYCSSLVSGGSGFRLPTLRELNSLVDLTLTSEPAIDNTAFPNAGPRAYWTSSPYNGRYPVGSSTNVRYGDFAFRYSNSCESSGSQNWTEVTDKLLVRCVR